MEGYPEQDSCLASGRSLQKLNDNCTDYKTTLGENNLGEYFTYHKEAANDIAKDTASGCPQVQNLLERLRTETADMIDQGEDLAFQMQKLYTGVHNLVTENMEMSQLHSTHCTTSHLGIHTQNSGIYSYEKTCKETLDRQIPIHSGFYSCEKIHTLHLATPCSNKLTVETNSTISSIAKESIQTTGSSNIQEGSCSMLSKCSKKAKGYFKKKQSNAGNDNLPFRESLGNDIYSPVAHKQTLSPNNSQKQGFFVLRQEDFNPSTREMDKNNGLVSYCVSKLENCHLGSSRSMSPITTLSSVGSSGYSSDKDISLPEDRMKDIQDYDTNNDSVLQPVTVNGKYSNTCRYKLDDSVIFCDNEIAKIHEHCIDGENMIHPDQIYEDLDNVNQRRCNSISTVNNIEHNCVLNPSNLLFKPITPDSDDDFLMSNTKRSKSNIFRKTPYHSYSSHTKVKRHHSLYEKRSKEYVCLSKVSSDVAITPPHITALPGFHPSWLDSFSKHQLRDYNFNISQDSAFRPYNKRTLVQRSQSYSEQKSLKRACFDDTSANKLRFEDRAKYLQKRQSMYTKHNFTKTYTVSTGADSGSESSGGNEFISSDFTHSSPKPMKDQPPLPLTLHYKSTFSPASPLQGHNLEQSVIYERIENESFFKKKLQCATPPELPERNANSKYHPKAKQSLNTNGIKRKSCRKTLKLEDIIKPTDVIHSSCAHMYTVADILNSVDNINKDIPMSGKAEKATVAKSSNLYSPAPAENRPQQKMFSMQHYTSVNTIDESQSSNTLSNINYSKHSQGSSLNNDTPTAKEIAPMCTAITPTANTCCTALTKRIRKIDYPISGHKDDTLLQTVSPDVKSHTVRKRLFVSKQKTHHLSTANNNFEQKNIIAQPMINWSSQNSCKEIYC